MFLSACGGTEPAGAGPADEEEDIAGRITSETGSPHDYIGRWELTEYDGDAPFAYIEITEESPYTVSCYDADAGLIDTGFINYSEQRALNGNDLMVFIFKDIGEYGAQPYFV
ncbi:MAG: hypothetical protein LBH39_03895, partial [Clostridiales Family XIII bacterium]|nr:hypothetical protein [Clostridiales Family XIII bacterium]